MTGASLATARHRLAYAGASVGVAVGAGDADPDALLREADAAMYAMKQARVARDG